MKDTHKEQTTPDQLMEAFRGSSLKTIVIFTVVVHVVVILATSAPYFLKLLSAEPAKQSDEERMESAVREAKASLRQIAEQHGLKPQDLSSHFTDGAPKAPEVSAKPAENAAKPAEAPAEAKPAEPEKPKSAIEKEIEKVEPGPVLPKVEDEDLFK